MSNKQPRCYWSNGVNQNLKFGANSTGAVCFGGKKKKNCGCIVHYRLLCAIVIGCQSISRTTKSKKLARERGDQARSKRKQTANAHKVTYTSCAAGTYRGRATSENKNSQAQYAPAGCRDNSTREWGRTQRETTYLASSQHFGDLTCPTKLAWLSYCCNSRDSGDFAPGKVLRRFCSFSAGMEALRIAPTVFGGCFFTGALLPRVGTCSWLFLRIAFVALCL